ncbi:MAG: glycerol kinase GlpK, partial [Planctomycetota bacterium]
MADAKSDRQYVAAIDAGTTSVRCVLFDRNGPVASAQQELEQITIQPGWLEHDPIELWQKTTAVIEDAMRSADAKAGDVGAIGLTNQRETTLVTDENHQPSRAIVWSDTRTSGLCQELIDDGGLDRFRDETGLPVATYFSASKAAWLVDAMPGGREKLAAGQLRVGTIDVFLLQCLTHNPAVTDRTNASRTLLMDLERGQWSNSVCGAFDMPTDALPTIVESIGGAFGVTMDNTAFGPGVPITAVLGDQHAALFGQCCFAPGDLKATYGTGAFLLMNVGDRRPRSTHGLLETIAYQHAGQPPVYALEGSVANAGSVVQWLRDNLGILERSEDVEPLADSVEDSGGVTFVPAFSGLFAPHWDASARGTLLGVTGQTTKAHLARATLDAVAFQVTDVVEAMRADCGREIKRLAVDGGMCVNDRLMQFQANRHAEQVGLELHEPVV